jgi:hypothetical protein
MAAHRMYRNGCEKNRGMADIVTRPISRISLDWGIRIYSIDGVLFPFSSHVLL